jgi:hypothetical protein
MYVRLPGRPNQTRAESTTKFEGWLSVLKNSIVVFVAELSFTTIPTREDMMASFKTTQPIHKKGEAMLPFVVMRFYSWQALNLIIWL